MISFLCPTTYGEKCPIEEYRSRIYRTKNESEIDKTRPIKRNESWLANVYVVKDPTNPDNEGKVKILRYGKQLNKIITDAISGDEADEFGAKVFDLSENGCSFKIKVEQNEGGYPTYVSSKFMSPSKLDEIDDIDEIYTQIKELDKIFNHKTYAEIKELLDFHFLGLEKDSQDAQQTLSENEDANYDNMVEIESNAGIFEKKNVVEKKKVKEETDSFDDADAKIEEILKDL
jgi:hypothetical protein